MLFEVVNTSGAVVMYTEDAQCVPSADDIEAIGSAGYRFKVDGKIIARTKVLDAVASSSGKPNDVPAAPVKPKTAAPAAASTQTTIVNDVVPAKPKANAAVSSSAKSKPKRLFDLDSILGNN